MVKEILDGNGTVQGNEKLWTISDDVLVSLKRQNTHTFVFVVMLILPVFLLLVLIVLHNSYLPSITLFDSEAFTVGILYFVFFYFFYFYTLYFHV